MATTTGGDLMRYLLAFDISQPRRYRQVVKAIKGYGYRVQYSVFELELESAEFTALWQQLCDQVDPDTDRLIATPLCPRCEAAVTHLGKAVERPDWQHLIV